MSDDEEQILIPRTHAEVQKLVDQAPAPETTTALIESATSGVCKTKEDDIKTRFAKWFTAACGALIIVIALLTLLQQRNSARDESDKNNAKAECRAVITGDINIAKAEGIKAGNNYQAILGNILVDAIRRTNPESFPPQADQLAQANIKLAAAALEIDQAIDRQRRVLEICDNP
jgi:hypothetical protein